MLALSLFKKAKASASKQNDKSNKINPNSPQYSNPSGNGGGGHDSGKQHVG